MVAILRDLQVVFLDGLLQSGLDGRTGRSVGGAEVVGVCGGVCESFKLSRHAWIITTD